MLNQLNSVITTVSLDEFAKAQKSCPDVKKLIHSTSLRCSLKVVDNCHACHLVKTPKHLIPPPGQLPTPAPRFNAVHANLVGCCLRARATATS